jgi:signal peptidase II
VVDYADLHFGAFRPFFIFNLADAAITIGVLIILARSFLSGEKRATRPQDRANTATES